MQIIQYAKAHPVATGAVAIIGGIIFIMIVRGGGSGGSSAPSGPSDAQIAANASLQAAQIQAQAGIQAAQIGAGVQLNSDNKAAEVAIHQLDVTKTLYEDQFKAQTDVATASIQAEQARNTGILNVINTLGKKRKNRAIQSFITGQPIQPTNPSGNSAAAILGGIGSAAAGIGQGLGSIFSDERLKENITWVGHDKNGRNLYSFNYRGSKTKHVGYIAQDIARAEPEKVVTGRNGYDRVMLSNPMRPNPVSLRSF